MYPLRSKTDKQKRKSEQGPKILQVREDNGRGDRIAGGVQKRARLRAASPAGSTTPACLQLYFKSRCDDVEAWKQLQELAEENEVAKALVCDVLIHNDALQRVGRDVELARLLSKDVHYWIAATSTENDPTIHGIKLYISGVCLAQGIGIPKNQARAAASIEQAAELGCCLAHYYMGVWFREGRGVARNAQVSVKLA